MTRLFDVQLIICYVLVIFTIRNSKAAEEAKKNEGNVDDDPLEALESRYRTRDRYNGNYGERQHKRTATELPITFQAPRYESKDYWNHRHYRRRDPDRRTFFDDYEYYPYDQRNPYSMMSGFYDLMNHFFGKDDYPKPKSGPYPFHTPRPHYSKAVHDPYPYEFPFDYRPTEANIIPPPKPVRASVVKLEAVTPEPELYPPLDYTTTAKYYPHFLNLLHQVLIENAKNQQINELGFHNSYYDPYINFRPKPVISSPKPVIDHQKPVLDRPKVYKQPVPSKDNIIPTTYKPKYFPANNATKPKYPGSIQDQLPPLKHGEEPKIPYVSATTIKLPPTTEKIPETTTMIDPRSGATDNIVFPTAEINTNKDLLADFDIRLLNANLQEAPTKVVEIKPTTTPRPPPTTTRLLPPTTLTDSFIPDKNTEAILSGESTETYRVTMVPPRKTSRSKKVNVPRPNDSVELITDLTVQGLSKNKIENVNIPRYINHFNMSNLINYEIDKLLHNQPIEPRTEKPEQSTVNQMYTETTVMPPMHTVDLNDELSLDAKILKDTNWDGITATEPSTTVENEITTQKIESTPPPENQTIVVETRVTKSVSKTVGFSGTTVQNQIHQNEVKEKDTTITEPTKFRNFPPRIHQNEVNEKDTTITEPTKFRNFPPRTHQNEVNEKDTTITEPTKFRNFDVLKQSSKVAEGRRKYYNRRPQVKLSVQEDKEKVTEPPTTPRFTISSEAPILASNTEESTKITSTEPHPAHTTITELLKITTENNEVDLLKRRMDKPNFEDTFDIAAMITKPTEPTYPKRKYFRRPKKTQYTSYPTQTEKIDNLKFGVINRSNFPKRSKPNVTLSFGTRKVAKKNENNIIKEEIMKFSDEDLRKKEEKAELTRNLYKRRKHPFPRLRTTERTLEKTSQETVTEKS